MSSVAKNFRKERAIYTFIICASTRFLSSISEHFRGCVQVAHCHDKEENILKRGEREMQKKTTKRKWEWKRENTDT